VLTALKLGGGLVSGSLGLVSAGIESSGDVVAATVTFFAVRLGARPADREHPCGHRRAENLSALAEATILLAGGAIVVVEAIGRLAGHGAAPAARWYVFAVIGLLVDFACVRVSLRTARAYRSAAALRSNAFHFAGDMAGSVAVLVGLSAREAIAALAPEIELHRLRVPESAGRYFADAVMSVPPGRAALAGHAAADKVERAVEQALPNSDVVVHVEPRRRGLELRDRVLAIALSEPLVLEAHDITIFEQNDQISVSMHLKFAADSSLADAHAIAERIEAGISPSAAGRGMSVSISNRSSGQSHPPGAVRG
jgi:divalent metal cation (Fe/Co/Zn/Cd) transporter